MKESTRKAINNPQDLSLAPKKMRKALSLEKIIECGRLKAEEIDAVDKSA